MKTAPPFFVEGGGALASEASLLVTWAAGSTAELLGERSLGITTGPVFSTGDGARLTVESVTPDRATERVTGGSVSAGETVSLEGYRFARSPLPMNVGELDSRSAARVAEAASSGSIQAIQNPDTVSHLLLRRRGDSVRVVCMDGATREAFATGPDGYDALTRHLRKEASAKRLVDLANLAQEFEVEVSLEGEARNLGLGRTVTSHARAERDGYLTRVDLGTDGTVTVLHPNRFEPENRVEARESYMLLSVEMVFEIPVRPPSGQNLARVGVTVSVPVGSRYRVRPQADLQAGAGTRSTAPSTGARRTGEPPPSTRANRRAGSFATPSPQPRKRPG